MLCKHQEENGSPVKQTELVFISLLSQILVSHIKLKRCELLGSLQRVWESVHS